MADYIAKIEEFYAKTPLDADGLAGRAPRRERLREILGTTGVPGSYQVQQPRAEPSPIIQGQEGGGNGTIVGQLVVVSGGGTETLEVSLVTK